MSITFKYDRNRMRFDDMATYALLYPNQDAILLVNKFGQNTDIDTAASEDIWHVGGNKVYLAAAETINIVSSSTDDIETTGTGAHLIEVYGIDADFNLIEEIVALNGTTNVLTVNSYLDIHRMKITQSGSATDNVGTITAISSGTATTVAGIAINDGITQMTHYTVPAGYTGFLLSETFSIYRADGAGTRQGELSLEINEGGTDTWLKAEVLGLNSTTTEHIARMPAKLSEKTRIKYRGVAATNNTAMSVHYEVLLIKNTEFNL